MQNYAQYKIINKETVGCPLCREEWNLELLKGDCRGQASLKNSCLPVYCIMCTFPQKNFFYRCIECSQMAVTQLKKPCDFCERCFINITREHLSHHFFSSSASVNDFHDVFWQPVINPRMPVKVIDRYVIYPEYSSLNAICT